MNHNRFPELLLIKVEAWPFIFPLHMVTGGLALVLVPLAIYLRGTPWHKWAGRVAAIDIGVAGVTAIPVALENPLTTMTGAGFTTQALLWLGFLGFGIWNIRNGRVKAHQNSMLLVAALTSGALFFRLFLAGYAAFGNHTYFKTIYSMDAWAGWLLPFCVMLLWIRFSGAGR